MISCAVIGASYFGWQGRPRGQRFESPFEGAKITGALIAYRLAEAVAEVAVIKAGQPAVRACEASFDCINARFYLERAHFYLPAQAIEARRRLADGGWYKQPCASVGRLG